MLEILLAILLLGLALSSASRKTNVDPFFIYFFIWFAIFFSYYFAQDTYIKVSNQFLLAIITINLFALTLLVIQKIFFNIKRKHSDYYTTTRIRESHLNACQILSALCIPLIYLKSIEISGGTNIFTIPGYISLRSAMTEEGRGYGPYAYIMIMAYAVSSIRFLQYIETRKHGAWTAVSIATSLFYVYLSTGRTFALLLATLTILPGILTNRFNHKSRLLISSIAIIVFASITTMTAKGVSIESSAAENILSLIENLRSYTVAPILAFSKLFEELQFFDFGQNTLRTPIAALNAINAIDLAPKNLIKDYELTPNPTNVYSVYEVYFRDFSIAGMLIPPMFLGLHFWLYKNALEKHGRWVFYYSISAYPLLMQFFQDQYFSLLSMLAQMVFWYTILISPTKSNTKKHPQ